MSIFRHMAVELNAYVLGLKELGWRHNKDGDTITWGGTLVSGKIRTLETRQLMIYNQDAHGERSWFWDISTIKVQYKIIIILWLIWMDINLT